jgi:hypothetical protein
MPLVISPTEWSDRGEGRLKELSIAETSLRASVRLSAAVPELAYTSPRSSAVRLLATLDASSVAAVPFAPSTSPFAFFDPGPLMGRMDPGITKLASG